ncbi:MAG: hypothetical protein WBW08_10635 [Methyloceanibacter sp.]
MASPADERAGVDRRLTAWRALWLTSLGLALIAGLAILLGNWTAGRSVDVAWHYVRVNYFFQSWHLVPQGDNPPWEGYAPIAYMVGGAIGRLVDQPFLGMSIVSLAFIFLIYVFVFLGLERKTLAATLASYASLFLAIAALHSTFALYGYEIVGNFFYAHAAGEAAFLALLFVLSGRERTSAELLLVPLLVLLLGWLFPLAQIKLAIGALVLWSAKLVQDWLATRRIEARVLPSLVILTGLLFAAIYFHPEFTYFRSIAEHNGATNQKIGLITIAAIAVALLAASLGLLALAISRKTGLARPLFIATAGLATVAAYAGQALLYFGFGAASEYAVRKHAYALTTLLAAALIALAVEAAERKLPRLSSRPLSSLAGGGPAAMIAAFATVFILISHYAEDRTPFLAYQQELHETPLLRGQTISLNRDFPPEFNLAASIVDLDLSPELNPFVMVILRRGELDPSVTKFPRFAIVSRKDAVPARCVSAAAKLATATLIDYGCK